ncbi:MAG TPA: hypothetical protein VNG13_01455 [Mycobacteriales bacterium]|nr:hypothetical protein [Mycobacteriales bacterium]
MRRLAACFGTLAALVGCASNVQTDVYGLPLPYPTAGVAVSNACGLLTLTEAAIALGDQVAPPAVGGDNQPPTCTWYLVTGAADLSVLVSTDPVDVDAARAELTPPLAPGMLAVAGLGSLAALDPSGEEVTVLLPGGGAVVCVRLTGSGGHDEVVRLARLVVRRLGHRRPAAQIGQLLA